MASVLTRSAVRDYAEDAIAGRIVVGKLVRQAAERHIRDIETGHERGLFFDDDAAEDACRFVSLLPHVKGEWARGNGRLKLEPWQRFLIGSLFGWKRVSDGLRRFRTAYVEVGRKNTKSTTASGIALKLAFFDGEPGAEVYSAAVKREQAKIVWGDARQMVLKTPGLRQHITALVGNLHSEETNSKYMPLGADADSMDGLNISGAIVDELHAHKTRAIVDVLETATAARRQPLILYITTAGSDRTSVCYERHSYAERVLSGTAEDDTLFALIYSIDEGDNWADEAVWPKANPNLGISVKIEDLRAKAERAKQLPTELNALRLHLNVWTNQVDRWIPLELWDAQAGEPIDEGALAGRLCYGGLDLSATRDLTAWVMVFPDPDDPLRVTILPRIWCPEAWVYSNENRYSAQYQAWVRDGWMLTTEGDEVDYETIEAQVLADAGTFRIAEVGHDRLFQGAGTGQALGKEGLTMLPIGQGFYGMAAPMKEFERRLLGKRLHHGGHPVLRFAAEGMSVAHDAAGNLKPDKSNPQLKIDPIVALVMALCCASRGETGVSVYEVRGALVI